MSRRRLVKQQVVGVPDPLHLLRDVLKHVADFPDLRALRMFNSCSDDCLEPLDEFFFRSQGIDILVFILRIRTRGQPVLDVTH